MTFPVQELLNLERCGECLPQSHSHRNKNISYLALAQNLQACLPFASPDWCQGDFFFFFFKKPVFMSANSSWLSPLPNHLVFINFCFCFLPSFHISARLSVGKQNIGTWIHLWKTLSWFVLSLPVLLTACAAISCFMLFQTPADPFVCL